MSVILAINLRTYIYLSGIRIKYSFNTYIKIIAFLLTSAINLLKYIYYDIQKQKMTIKKSTIELAVY